MYFFVVLHGDNLRGGSGFTSQVLQTDNIYIWFADYHEKLRTEQGIHISLINWKIITESEYNILRDKFDEFLHVKL